LIDPASSRQPASPGLRMALDYGPLLVFFAVNFLMPGLPIVRVLAATGAFMAAMVVAVVVSWVKTRHVSPMLWLTAVLVIVFGGLTLYFHDQKFIQMKPTFVYAVFALVLGFGVISGRPLLKLLLGSAYPGLSAEGWRKLTRNWALFFVFMAALNETVWRTADAVMTPEAAWNAWVLFKFPGCVIITLVFAIANVPMLLKHGLAVEKDAVTDIPPEG
jgi:intracellular septation protein